MVNRGDQVTAFKPFLLVAELIMFGLSSLSPTGSTAPPGRDFYDLVKAIGESKSKQEEDRIIMEEVAYLKKALQQTATNKKKHKELVIRSLYVEMLGQDGTFAYLKIVELCASSNLVFKKAGYLAASLTLNPDHEFRLMLVNRIQQDMKSPNQLEACVALSGVCRLVTVDMVPAVFGEVLKLLSHEMQNVRKKAVNALHKLYQLDPDCLVDHYDKINQVLCDQDPAVMASSLPLILELARANVVAWRDLVPHLVSILKQIVEHRLPKDFDYHRIPAPWVQMNLLRILSVLGRGDKASSEGMYEVLMDVIRRADTGINVGYAIVYECVTTITTIYPNSTLLDAAATSISRFIRSDSHNLKYIGIKGLAAIVRDHPQYAADHQMAVIDCLEDPDETLKRKTLGLLYKMTNGVNVEFVVEKLLGFLQTAKDEHFREDLVEKLTLCAERYAPSNAWYVRSMMRVFELAGDKVTRNAANTLVQLIAEGTGEDEDEDEEGGSEDELLRAEAVSDFYNLVSSQRFRSKLPPMLVQSMLWVLGEYGYLSKECSSEQIVDCLCHLVNDTEDAHTRSAAVSATMKLCAQMGACPPVATAMINKCSNSSDVDVQQRCREFKTLLSYSTVMVDVLPLDASCEDIEVEEGLPFLDSYVNAALAKGAIPYSPPMRNDDDDDALALAEHAKAKSRQGSLNFAAYEAPTTPSNLNNLNLGSMSSVASAGAQSGQGGPGGTGGDAGGGGMSGGQSDSAVAASMLSPPTNNLNGAAVNNAVLAHQGVQLLAGGGAGGPWGRNMQPITKPSMEVTEPADRPPSPPLTAEASVERYNNALSMPSNPSSANDPPVLPSSAPEPVQEKSREQSEKEKMAAALFGGVGSGSAGTKRGITSRRRQSDSTGKVDNTGNQAINTLISSSNDLNEGSQQVQETAESLFSGGDPSDLFGGMTLNTETESATENAPAVGMPGAPSTSATGRADDLLGALGLPAQTSPLVLASNSTPLEISTPEFGEKWGSLAGESAGGGTLSKVSDLADLRSTIESSGNYAHVETIADTREAIFAGSSNTSGDDLLVHVKLEGTGSFSVLVKASSASEADSERKWFEQALK